MKGLKKAKPNIDLRLPITHVMLKKLVDSLVLFSPSVCHRVMFQSTFLSAFAAFLRVGEIIVSNYNVVNVIQKHCIAPVACVCIAPVEKNIIFYQFKHSKGRQASLDIRKQNGCYCPVTALDEYFKLRGDRPGFLYCWPDDALLSVDLNSQRS